MKKNITRTILGLGLIAGFTGCSTGPQTPQIHNTNLPQKEVKVNFNFIKRDPITNKKIKVDISKLKSQIANDMLKYSKYYEFRATYWSNSGIVDYSGLRIYTENKDYKLDYANGERDNNWYLNEIIFKVPYDIDINHLTLKYPIKYTQINCNDAIGMTIPPLDTPNNLKKDVINIINKLSKTKFYFIRTYTLKGEINSKYNANSIYANFKRLMGQYPKNTWFEKQKISPIEKKNYFALKIKNKVFPLKIEVYPYRNGSKVIYHSDLTYKIFSDGTSSLTKQDIENAKKTIFNVVNN